MADLTAPPGVTTRIGPFFAAAGTVASISVGDTTLYVAVKPLKPTCEACTKPVPVITTVAPTAALVGEMLLMVGSSRNAAELVAVVDPALTAILPALPAAGTVAVMLVGPFTVKAAAAPLNVTDVAEVKPDPVIVTVLPTMPLAGAKPLTARLTATEAVKLRSWWPCRRGW